MIAAIDLMLLVLVGLLAIPVTVFVVQVLLAVFTRMPARTGQPPQRQPVAVLVPAHNEALVIEGNLRQMLTHLRPGDRLLVVADNCSDDTAAIARSLGVEVTERFNATLRGKGYALDHGVKELAKQPPSCVVIVDADCRLHEGALDWLAHQAAQTGRPAQAVYLMTRDGDNQAVSPVAVFAWKVRNLVRPLGMSVLGWPCHLTGSGMAFTWPLIRDLALANGHIVEDMKMGVDLAHTGHPPMLCREALVTSTFAVSREGADAQRTRWEHGTLGMMLQAVPVMLLDGLRGRGKGLLPMALDTMVPPLALLVMLLAGFTVLAAVWHAICVTTLVLCISVFLLAVLSLSVLMAWWRFGRDILSPAQVPALFLYLVGKLPIYLKFLVKRQVEWVRAKRDGD